MKMKMKKALMALGAAVLLSGCGFGMIWDIAPVDVYMEVVDKDGNNRFEEATPGNWLQSEITATFEGESYTYPQPGTRAYMAIMGGLVVRNYRNADGRNTTCLIFGELSGETDRHSDLVITWPDGTSDKITVDNSFRWGVTGRPHKKTTFSLNGEPVSIPIRIVK